MNLKDKLGVGGVYNYTDKNDKCTEGVVLKGFSGTDDDLTLHFRDTDNGIKNTVLAKDLKKLSRDECWHCTKII